MAYPHGHSSRSARTYGHIQEHTSKSYAQRYLNQDSSPKNKAKYYGRHIMDDEESDYISQPEYSKSDYIVPDSHASQGSRTVYGTRPSRHSNPDSDYICPPPPVESRDDYILPHSNKTSPSKSKPVHQEKHRHIPSRRVSFNDDTPPRSRRSSEARPGFSPLQEKSNYQLMKDAGFSNKREFMRAHGLRTWEPEDYDRANEILDKYRDMDAQHVRRRSSGTRRERHASRSSSVEFQTYPPPRGRDSPDIEDVYGSDSSAASIPRHSSPSPARHRHRHRHLSHSPDPRYYSHSPSHSPPSIHGDNTQYPRGHASPDSFTHRHYSSSPDNRVSRRFSSRSPSSAIPRRGFSSRSPASIHHRSSSPAHHMPGHFPSRSPSRSPSRHLSQSPPSMLRRAYSSHARALTMRSRSRLSGVFVDGSDFASIDGGDRGSDVALGEEAYMSETVVDSGSGSEDEDGGGEGYMHNEYDEIDESEY